MTCYDMLFLYLTSIGDVLKEFFLFSKTITNIVYDLEIKKLLWLSTKNWMMGMFITVNTEEALQICSFATCHSEAFVNVV